MKPSLLPPAVAAAGAPASVRTSLWAPSRRVWHVEVFFCGSVASKRVSRLCKMLSPPGKQARHRFTAVKTGVLSVTQRLHSGTNLLKVAFPTNKYIYHRFSHSCRPHLVRTVLGRPLGLRPHTHACCSAHVTCTSVVIPQMSAQRTSSDSARGIDPQGPQPTLASSRLARIMRYARHSSCLPNAPRPFPSSFRRHLPPNRALSVHARLPQKGSSPPAEMKQN